jgi:hypothetical protein
MSDDTTLLPDLYLPLDLQKPQIRVLVLNPSIDSHARLEGRFLYGDLTDVPEYAALSYTWGEGRHAGSIMLEGGKLTIPMNLQQGLLRLRHSRNEQMLWADAVCINQSDVQERNHQVSLMGQIYRKATTVMVWLGELDEGSKNTPQILENFNASVTKGAAFSSNELTRVSKSVEALLTHSWWRRAWVMQEVMLASHVSVLLGSRQLPWKTLETAFMLYKETMVYSEREGNSDSLLDAKAGVRSASAIFDSRVDTQKEEGASERSLHNLILANAGRNVLDPRDRIYALLGLASDRNTGYATLPVDYSSSNSVELLFEAFYRQCVRLKQSLDVLLWPWPENLPSPPWIHSSNNSPLSEPLVRPVGQPGHKSPVSQSHPFHGHGHITVTTDRTIIFEGIPIDRIEAVGGVYTTSQYEGLPFPRSWTALGKIEELVAMLIQGFDHTSMSQGLYTHLVKYLTSVYHQGEAKEGNPLYQAPNVPKGCDRPLQWMYNLTRGRRLFRTTQWADLGLAPAGARNGDGMSIYWE